MKKKLFLTLVAIMMLVAPKGKAQLADGTSVPNFTFNDINGVSRDLYTYLNAGKTVYLDVFATWCSPCWAFYNTHAMENLYKQHGPTGTISTDIIALMIEDDPTTNLADLHGTGTNTQGDWLTGNPMPMIDLNTAQDNVFANSSNFDITGYPTLYMICPDKKVYNLDNTLDTTAALMYAHKSSCPATTSIKNTDLASSIRVFPNPASSILNVELRMQHEGTEITLYDVLGNEVISTKETNIDVSSLANGVYFINLKTSDGLITKKLMVQH